MKLNTHLYSLGLQLTFSKGKNATILIGKQLIETFDVVLKTTLVEKKQITIKFPESCKTKNIVQITIKNFMEYHEK